MGRVTERNGHLTSKIVGEQIKELGFGEEVAHIGGKAPPQLVFGYSKPYDAGEVVDRRRELAREVVAPEV